jgi:Type-F conjugative transfer system protein (TrbI_Ftype)
VDHGMTIMADLPLDDDALRTASRALASCDKPTNAAAAVDPLSVKQVAKRGGFAGFSYVQLAFGAMLLLASIWAMWATSKIFMLDDRRVVSVRLASIINDFVAAEARSSTPPEQLGARTQAFMMALDAALKKRAAAGQVVLIGEAVVASSVPDVTANVVADLAKRVNMPGAVALPLAMPPLAPVPSPAIAPTPFDTTTVPDGASIVPSETGPQQ